MVQNKLWKVLAGSSLLLQFVTGFGIELFSSGSPIYSKMTSSVVFTGDYPKLVTFKIAVLNKDNTLTSIEEYNAYNTMTGTFQQIRIPDNIEPGINYYYVAVDNDNSLNYATLGPLVIHELFSQSNPSNSVTADSGISYQTDAQSVASATGSASLSASTTTSSSATGSVSAKGSSSSTYEITSPTNSQSTNNKHITPSPSVTDTSKKNDDDSGPNIAAIAGGAAGGVAFIAIICWIVLYKYCIKRIKLENLAVTYNPKDSKDQKNEQSDPAASTTITMPSPTKSSVSPIAAPLSPQKPQISHHKPENLTTSTENTFVPPYPYAQQQGYPSYPYPQDLNFSGDYMPIPEHFGNANQPYPPMSPTIQNNMYPPQPQYPVYNPQQGWSPQQYINPFIAGGYPPMAENHEDKTTDLSFADKLLADTSNLHGVKTDKEEYQQKPDTVSDAQIAFGKPDDANAKPDFNKPHKR